MLADPKSVGWALSPSYLPPQPSVAGNRWWSDAISTRPTSRQDILYHFARFDTRQPEIEALGPKGKAFVIDA